MFWKTKKQEEKERKEKLDEFYKRRDEERRYRATILKIRGNQAGILVDSVLVNKETRNKRFITDILLVTDMANDSIEYLFELENAEGGCRTLLTKEEIKSKYFKVINP